MNRTVTAIAAAALICVVGAALSHEGKSEVKRKVVSEQNIAEKIDGKDSKATVVEVTLEPGQESAPHRHPGPVFGYILEGEYDWAINDQPVKKLKAGDTFYEPAMSLHRVSRNPSEKAKARILATLVVPRDAKDLSIPEPKK
jgi:quercetin dioxygenase-like cupin family protein